MSDIFISYARADKDKAELLANAFSRKGWSVWWDRQIPPGQSFDDTIESALNSARCVIVLWSTHSVSSRWVKTEAAEGAERGILVPVMIDHAPIPLEFKRIEAADLSDWEGEVSHREFDQLQKSVASMIAGTAPAPKRQIALDSEGRSELWWKKTPGVFAVVGVAAVGFILLFQQAGFLTKRKPPPHSQNQAQPESSEAAQPERLPVGQNEAGSLAKPARSAQAPTSATNLLSAENGGHVIVGTNDQWVSTIDGDEKNWQYIDIGVVGSWAVYGFKDDKPARFDTFKVLILGSESWNLKEFELLAGNDSPTGKFESIGKFQTENVRFFKDPYQEFKFPPVKARYLKVRVISSHGFSSVGAYEFQLLGALEG
ncbi:MAG TPA: TIR domain-containing protein [Candidatus Binatia bacterium]